MKLHRLITAGALSLAVLPFAAHAQNDSRSQEWVQSIHSTKTRAEVLADARGLTVIGEGDPPALRFAEPVAPRTRAQVLAELAAKGPIIVGA